MANRINGGRRQDTDSGKVTLKKYSAATYLKFVVYSAFGILAFFINFSLPAYTVLGYEVGAQSTILVTHCVNIVKALLWSGSFKAMPVIVWLIGVYSIVDLFILRPHKFWHTSKIAATFAVFKCIGFIFLTATVCNYYFGFAPTLLIWYFAPLSSLGNVSISFFIMNKILISICISIPMASLFLPFLLDYGLVDFVGVIVRPIMRPIFRLPGRAAVIMVSAFLGNFSIGHIAINDQYQQGRMTEREAYAIGTSLSTVSVGFLMVLATNTNIMGYWNLYFWSTFLITLLVALIGVRIYPLSKVKDNYYEGVTPVPEISYNTKLFSNAYKEGMNVAGHAAHPGKRIAYIMHETIGVLGTVASGTAFFAAAGVVIYTYTPIFRWIGYVFYPFMRIAIPANEAVIASTGAAVSFLEVTIPALLVTTGEWTLRVRYMMAVIPVTSIIFLASFVPCLMATEVPVKFHQLCIIWLERMLLSIIITALFSLIFFPDGAM